MRVLLAQPRGFCAGVDRAIEIVERAIKMFGAPIHVRHEIVHNRYVVNHLRDQGAIFVERVDEVPEGAFLILSAHGVSQAVHKEAAQRNLRILDATCPLVAKVHMELLRHHQNGTQVILIGHAGHPEVQGALGQVPEGGVLLISNIGDIDDLHVSDPEKLAYATQTTLSIDDTATVVQALKQRFPGIEGPTRENICYATSNRQMAVKQLASACDVVLVIGSRNSSNSNRLKEVAERSGDCTAYLVDQAADIDPAWLVGKEVIGITAGASAPEVLVQEVLDFLKGMGAESIKATIATEEHVKFSLPEVLRHTDISSS